MSNLSTELRQPSLEQIVKNHVKVARMAIGLKHRIEADNEIALAIPELRKRLAAQMQDGYVEGLSVAQMLDIVDGQK
jgi:hypothetical protein